MSNDDLLTRATQALRDASEVAPDEVAATRARIMGTLRKSERRRGRIVVFVLPFAALLAAGTALGRNGGALRSAWENITARWHDASHPLADSRARGGVSASPGPAGEDSAAPELAPTETAPPELAPAATAPIERPPMEGALPLISSAPHDLPIVRAHRPGAAPHHAATATAASAATAAASDRDSDRAAALALADERERAALQRYERAHRLHFREQSYAAALTAWDEYLANTPGGALAVEARYNRAIALVRLDHRAEATAALRPFARGEVGHGYRQTEARALLSAMAGADAGLP
jgi:hypothetical protein